jgi:hypothetical protein
MGEAAERQRWTRAHLRVVKAIGEGLLTAKEAYLQLHLIHLGSKPGWDWDNCSTRFRILIRLGFLPEEVQDRELTDAEFAAEEATWD